MASEAVGLVSVCVNISGTVLDRNITVLLSTEDNTAICECVFVPGFSARLLLSVTTLSALIVGHV